MLKEKQEVVNDKISALLNEIEKERNEDFRESRRQNELLERFNRHEITLAEIDDEETLYLLLSDYKDSNEFLQLLNEMQKRILFGYIEKVLQQNTSALNERIDSLLRTKEELNRRVIPFLRVQISDHPSMTHRQNKIGRTKLTIWNATPELFEIFQEGNHLKIYFLTPARNSPFALRNNNPTVDFPHPYDEYRYGEGNQNAVHLMADARSRYKVITRVPPPNFTPRMVHTLRDFNCLRPGKEFDTVGLIVAANERHEETVIDNGNDDSYADENTKSCNALSFQKVFLSQTLFLTDMSEIILAIQMRLFQDNFPSLELLTPGNVIAVTNLVYRFYDGKAKIHVCVATEYSEFFGRNTTQSHLRKAKEEIEQWAATECVCIQELKQRVINSISGPLK